MSWHRRLFNAFRSDRVARDIEREMAFHLAERIDELVASGMSEREARREARRRFGDGDELRERTHRVVVMGWLDSLLADVRYALRTLRGNPGFTAVAVLSLGLGIGANTAIFSLINAVMLRSLPVSHPEELVQLELRDQGDSFTNPLWESIRDRDEGLAGTLAFSGHEFDLSQGGVHRTAAGALVSGGYFDVLGVGAARGRVLQPADDVRGCAPVAVLGNGFWQREYGGDDDAIGRTISLGGHPFEIIGVAPPGFSGIHVGRSSELFAPLCSIATLSSPAILDARSTWFLTVIGRLPPGGTLAEARAALAGIAPRVLAATVPTHWAPDEQREYTEDTLVAESATNGVSVVRGQYRDALFTLLVVVGVVLLIACANLAQLLLARAAARQHEVALRLALGSKRGRLVRQLLTESMLLAGLGAAVGVLFARWSSGVVVRLLRDAGRAVSLDLSLDLRVLGFAIAIATATGLLFGLAPAWRAVRVDPQHALRGGGRGLVGDSRHRFGRGIVVGQVALSLVLVIGAGLLVGSFRRLATIDLGFRPEGVLVASAEWSRLQLDDERRPDFPRELLDRVRAVPGVSSASASLTTPISGSSWNDYVSVDGYAPESPNDALVWFNGVTDGYLETLGIRRLSGRDIDPRDRAGAPSVALVNQTFARRFFGDADALGKALRVSVHDSLGPPIEIIGVIEDSKYSRVDEDTYATAYVPLEQTSLWGPGVSVSIRTATRPEAVIPAVTAAIVGLDPSIGIEYATLEDQLAISLARPRLLATLSGFFGALALLLAVIGLYGTMSYTVARRRNEMGIRIALGAARSRILRLIAGEASRVVAIGVVAGVLIALAATRLIVSFLFGVTATDPVTLALSCLALAVVAMAAALVPAWRAAAVDPLQALRDE